MELFAVVPTHNRPDELAAMLVSLGLSCSHVLVIDNASEPPVDLELLRCRQPLIEGLWRHRVEEQPPNLSRLWNIGLDWAEERAGGEPYAVAVLNDDLILPTGFMHRMAAVIERTGAAVAFPDQHGRGHDLFRTEPGPVPLAQRMTGYCFVLNGKTGLRADEHLRWWFGDDDLEWQAHRAGGTVLVGGVTVQHLHPDESTAANPELQAQAERDRAAFVAKWGQAPW